MQKCCSPVRSYWLSRRCLFWCRTMNSARSNIMSMVSATEQSAVPYFMTSILQFLAVISTIWSQWSSSDRMRQTETKYYVSRLKALSLLSLTWVNLHLHGSILNNFKKKFKRWRKADTSSTFDYTRKRVSSRNVDRMYVMSVSVWSSVRTHWICILHVNTREKLSVRKSLLSERVAFSTIKN